MHPDTHDSNNLSSNVPMRLMATMKKLKSFLLEAANRRKPEMIISNEQTDATRGPYRSRMTPMQRGPRKEKKLATTNLQQQQIQQVFSGRHIVSCTDMLLTVSWSRPGPPALDIIMELEMDAQPYNTPP
jgi:hypothetical protein